MDKSFRHRLNAGRVAIEAQIAFFERQFADVSSEWKEDETRVTFADFAISERIFAELRRSFPEDDFCSEEFNPRDEVLALEAHYCWILDPIDGTNNYAIGIPMCGISLALLEEGHPVYGWIYDFARKEIIHGGPEGGLFDGRRRVVPENAGLARHAMIAVHFPLETEVCAALVPVLARYRVRSLGSASLALAYTALGFLDGSIDLKVSVWDIAAGYGFVRAAGREFLFLDEAIFPIRAFHVELPATPYVAGRADFCAEVRECLGSGATRWDRR